MSNIFSDIKSRCDLPSVLSLYGRTPNANGMISCPFHGKDEHPSMRVYSDGLYSFSCGWHGDAIAFVERMDSCTAIEAARKLNDVFLLGVDFGKPMTAKETELWRRQRKIKSAERAFDSLADDALQAELAGDHEKYQEIIRQREQLDAEITRLENESSAASGAEHAPIPEEYTWDSTGIFYIFTPPKGSPIVEYVCRTAIQISGVYADEDTGLHSVVLSFHDGMRSRRETFDRQMLTDPQTVKKLSGYGVTITSAKHLALAFALRLHNCPVMPSASRLGWFGSEFVPYSSQIHCLTKSTTCEVMLQAAASPCGLPEFWTNTASEALRASCGARFAVSASLSSPFLRPAQQLGFGVHLFGKTGTGKTVCLLLAASIWGNPQNLMKSMSSTAVGMEKTAAFLCNLPLMLDELQEVSNKDVFENIVYMLSNGKSKTRGTKEGGIADESRWLSVSITTGEQAILDDDVCTGAENRLLSVDMSDENYGRSFGSDIVDTISKNYGHAGRKWIQYIQNPENVQAIKARATDVRKELRQAGYLDKQLISCATLKAVSEAAANVLFGGDMSLALSIDDMLPRLVTLEEADKDKKGVEFLKGWIAGNAKSFENGGAEFQPREVFGKWQDNECWIISNKFNDVLKKASFSPKDVFSEAVRMGVSEWQFSGDHRRRDRNVRVNGKQVRCVLVRFSGEDSNDCSENELPF